MKVAIQELGAFELTVCSPTKAAKIIGVCPDTIRRHIREERKGYMTDNHLVFLKVKLI